VGCPAPPLVAALAAACAAIFTAGRVADPVSDETDGTEGTRAAGAAARLRTGIRLTIGALILAVIAAWCGPLSREPAGALSIRTAHDVITVPSQDIAQVRPIAKY
jgi:hypothetical protein